MKRIAVFLFIVIGLNVLMWFCRDGASKPRVHDVVQSHDRLMLNGLLSAADMGWRFAQAGASRSDVSNRVVKEFTTIIPIK